MHVYGSSDNEYACTVYIVVLGKGEVFCFFPYLTNKAIKMKKG